METPEPQPRLPTADDQLTPQQLRARRHRQAHPEVYRKSARKFFDNNREKVLRANALRRANAYGVTPRQSTIQRYNLVFEGGVWR